MVIYMQLWQKLLVNWKVPTNTRISWRCFCLGIWCKSIEWFSSNTYVSHIPHNETSSVMTKDADNAYASLRWWQSGTLLAIQHVQGKDWDVLLGYAALVKKFTDFSICIAYMYIHVVIAFWAKRYPSFTLPYETNLYSNVIILSLVT